MILTTTIKQPYTTTKHNNNGYIFTLYLFMLLCVVGNCLLFYCSCTGNCENCCGINGLLRIANIDQDGKVDCNKILHTLFVNGENKASVNVSIYRGSTEKDYNDAKKEFLESINTKDPKHLSAYVEVGDTARYFIHYKDANSIKDGQYYYGLFQESKATKIVILSCGNNITNMGNMFNNCDNLLTLDLSSLDTNKVTNMNSMFSWSRGLKELDLSNFNTNNVTNMGSMFSFCRSLTNIKFSNNFNTSKVIDMGDMFDNCISLTKLDLSNFITDEVKYMFGMFNNCFTEEQTSILICTASTIQKITENENSYLTIPNYNEIKNTIANDDNQVKVYKCSVKRVGDKPEITAVEEYQLHQ